MKQKNGHRRYDGESSDVIKKSSGRCEEMIEENALVRARDSRVEGPRRSTQIVHSASYALLLLRLHMPRPPHQDRHRVQLAFVTDPDEASLARAVTRIQPTSTNNPTYGSIVEFNMQPSKTPTSSVARPFDFGADLNLSVVDKRAVMHVISSD